MNITSGYFAFSAAILAQRGHRARGRFVVNKRERVELAGGQPLIDLRRADG
jgi:hypothetical protein